MLHYKKSRLFEVTILDEDGTVHQYTVGEDGALLVVPRLEAVAVREIIRRATRPFEHRDKEVLDVVRELRRD